MTRLHQLHESIVIATSKGNRQGEFLSLYALNGKNYPTHHMTPPMALWAFPEHPDGSTAAPLSALHVDVVDRGSAWLLAARGRYATASSQGGEGQTERRIEGVPGALRSGGRTLHFCVFT